MSILTAERKIYCTLRVAIAMCFIGHGVFGIITKQVWCNYFGVFGIDTALSYKLMPVVGIVDILMGLAMLVYPMRALPVWLVFWGLLTALLRPLSGEPFVEFIERAGNYGAPLALLLLTGMPPFTTKKLFAPISSPVAHDPEQLRRVTICLKIVVFLLLAAHGWLNLMEKKALLDQYSPLGFATPANVAQAVGIFEIVAAFSILIKPVPALLLVIFMWKMFSESFYQNYPVFEWIERGGSYGAILALWFAVSSGKSVNASTGTTRWLKFG